jgi:hypothetical protein
MTKYDNKFHSFGIGQKKDLPVVYNCIYRFNKKGLVRKKGERYYGTLSAPLQTPAFFPWGHEKAISRALDFSAVKPPKKTHERKL